MKKIRFNLRVGLALLLMISGLGPLGCSSKQEAELINSAANTGVVIGAYSGFHQTFPQAQSVQWISLSPTLWEARFMQNQTSMGAWLHYDGTVLDQGRRVALADLPTGIHSYLARYSDQSIQSILLDQTTSTSRSYRILISKSGHWHRLQFDSNGQLLSDASL